MTVLIIDMLTKSLGGHDLQLIIYCNENKSLYDLNIGLVEYVKERHKVPWKVLRDSLSYRRSLSGILSYLKDAEANGLVFPFDLDSLDEEIKKYKLKKELDRFVIEEE